MSSETLVVAVKDAIEIRPNLPGSAHAPGLIVIFDGRQCGFELPSIGAIVEFIRPDGETGRATLAEIKEHGDGRSFFFVGLHRDDVPIGSILSWAARAAREAAEPRDRPVAV